MIAEIPTAKKSKASPMTDQHKQLLLNFMHEFYRVKGIYPTFEEMAMGIGWLSAGTVHKSLVEPLIAEGWLKRVHPGARAIVPTREVAELYCAVVHPELKRVAKQQRNLRILRRL